jgi:hypothetical protein
MPQETDNLILIKRSNVLGAMPALSSLELGELGINTADGKLFTRTELDSISSIKTFLNSEDYPYTLNHYYSSVNFKYGNNTVNQIFAGVLGGYDNDVSGGGSTVINGEDNDISGDFSIIGSGLNNKITINGDYGAILGGQNNNLTHQESFIIGSNITSHSSNFTYVNNLSSTGKFYGDGSELTGIVSGDSEATTLVRSNSSNWDSTYSTVQSNSSLNWDNSLSNQYTHTNFLPLTGGNLTGELTTTSTISSSQIISANGARVITGLSTDSTPVYYITVLTQGDYDAIASPDPNILYFIKP